jgi:hypothetical protein
MELETNGGVSWDAVTWPTPTPYGRRTVRSAGDARGSMVVRSGVSPAPGEEGSTMACLDYRSSEGRIPFAGDPASQPNASLAVVTAILLAALVPLVAPTLVLLVLMILVP